MGWSMDWVHGPGPWGGPWTPVHVLYTSSCSVITYNYTKYTCTRLLILPWHFIRVSPSCIRQIYALSSSPPETAMELFTGSIDTEKTEAEDKDRTVLMK